jgi:outer membrane protein OmpA-like peptidoglycan-associated protein
MKKNKSNLLLIVFFTMALTILTTSKAQTKDETYFRNVSDKKFKTNKFLLSLEGGFTQGFTDYKNQASNSVFRFITEYNFQPVTGFNLGFGLRAGLGKIDGKDNRNIIASNDGPRNIPPKISTQFFELGFIGNIGFDMFEVVNPYFMFSASYFNFNPKLEDGSEAAFNKEGKYEKIIANLGVGGGMRYNISKAVSLYVQGEYFIPNTDYLEDISASKSKDSFISITLGFSYNLLAKRDTDGDGIPDDVDECIKAPETFNGYKDEDGCPEFDSDGDGIIDDLDNCIGIPEDYNGIKDDDGCPDADRDGDGIPDYLDKCPDEAEDIDGFQDQDGCPDFDNDKDGILDKDDECPDEAETINGYLDEDGCPDEVELGITVDEMVLSADDLFQTNSSKLKETATAQLNDLVKFLKGRPNTKWRIEGHMDSQGSASFIKKLSYDRAKAVYDYLVSKGLDGKRFEIYGLADNFPIANNLTEEGRKQNRRIRIVLQK